MNMHRSSNAESLSEIQHTFTDHIRDPGGMPAPGDLPDERMNIYRMGIYLNFERMISNFFPVLKKLYSEERWEWLVKQYLKVHRAQIPPLLPMLGKEFLLYLEYEHDLKNEPGFILELAHYEWIGFSLSIDSREIELAGIDREGSLLDGVPAFSPLALPLSYRYPVHRLSPGYTPELPPEKPTYLIVYRNLDYRVGYLELNPVSARLVEKIRENTDRSARELLEEIAVELHNADSDVVITGGIEILDQLYNRNILLGTCKSSLRTRS